MARARSPDSIEAEKLYQSGMKLVEIAEKLAVPDGTVRRWKSTQKWEGPGNGKSERSEKKKASVRKPGPPKGNKNAEGAGAPEGNKNAVKTGEFETLFFDTLEEDEKQLINLIEPDKEKLLLQEIQLLTVRERRMLKRIDSLKGLDFTLVKKKKETEKDKWTDLNEEHGVLGQIQSIEDALTRVQARKQKAIDSLHKYGFDDSRLEIELIKIERASLKMDNQGQEIEDDGFLQALNAETTKLWGDAGED